MKRPERAEARTAGESGRPARPLDEPRLLVVDLTAATCATELIPRSAARRFLGGFGLNQWLASQWLPAGAEPLGDENVVVLGAGLLVGLGVPGASRICATTRLPLSGAVATASGSMRFGRQMRAAGFEHVVVTGRASRPVYLLLQDGRAELVSAADLWGRDIYGTTDLLGGRHGRAAGVIAIGPAGERQVPLALCLVDKSATLGKGGLGAVFGSKGLKAIVAAGGSHLPGGDSRTLGEISSRIKYAAQADPATPDRLRLGGMAKWEAIFPGGILFDNYRRLYPKDRLRPIYGPEIYAEKAFASRRGCPSCPVPDKDRYEVKDGECAGLVTYGNSFIGRMLGFGLRGGAGDYGQALAVHDRVNRLGLCGHSLVALFEFCLELREAGLLKGEHSDGLERGYAPLLAFVNDVAEQRGLGRLVAGGYPALLAYLGPEAEARAVQIGGVDVIFDPRDGGLGTVEFEQLVSPRHHWVAGQSPTYGKKRDPDEFRRFCRRIGLSQAEEASVVCDAEVDVPRLTRHAEDWYVLLSSLGICNRGHIDGLFDFDTLRSLIDVTLGAGVTDVEIRESSERSWTLQKVLNSREGFDRRGDRPPSRWFEPLERIEGGTVPSMMDYGHSRQLRPADLEVLLDAYYESRGWDVASGTPGAAVLGRLGLGAVRRPQD